jgi:hypothetical protein
MLKIRSGGKVIVGSKFCRGVKEMVTYNLNADKV